ncbi:MAG: Fic family protein [Bariatricus sp.]
MKHLLEAYREWEKNMSVPAPVMAACFALDFICIHPFPDGNGRMSRILFGFLMQRHGYPGAKFLTTEEYIMKNKASYIYAERCSSVDWYNAKNQYRNMISFCLHMLKECYEMCISKKESEESMGKVTDKNF